METTGQSVINSVNAATEAAKPAEASYHTEEKEATWETGVKKDCKVTAYYTQEELAGMYGWA